MDESLEKHLFKLEGSDKLDSMDRRLDIIKGIAKDLLYLHDEERKKSLIHLDIKPRNILLDEDWVPKLADYGMARTYPKDRTN